MSEPTNKLVVERYKRGDYGEVEYTIRIGTAFRVDEYMERSVPTRVIAGYLCNNLREFVNSATVDEYVRTIIEQKREAGVYNCPTCHQEVTR